MTPEDPHIQHFNCPTCNAPIHAYTLWRCDQDPELHKWVGNWDDVLEQANRAPTTDSPTANTQTTP